MFTELPEGTTNSFTPLAQVVMDMRDEYDNNFSAVHYAPINARSMIRSHINETLIEVLEKMKEECEKFDFGRDMFSNGYNTALQSQIDLINKTIEQIK
jgi:hypothetical protein